MIVSSGYRACINSPRSSTSGVRAVASPPSFSRAMACCPFSTSISFSIFRLCIRETNPIPSPKMSNRERTVTHCKNSIRSNMDLKRIFAMKKGRQEWISNLYPTPHTVFNCQLWRSPSFSRIRFTCTSTVRESPKKSKPQTCSSSCSRVNTFPAWEARK